MFKLIMYMGIIGMITGCIMTLFLSKNKPTNNGNIPTIARIGLIIFIVSIILAIIGAFCSSELGYVILK